MKPDRNVPRVHRMLAMSTEPQAVLKDRQGRLELVPAASPRVAALPSDRIVGVFYPDVPLQVFAREVSL